MHYRTAKHILSAKNGMNVYRGCTHGCIYCDSRSTCYGFDHPFEDVEIKRNAPELLEDELSRKRSRAVIGTGSMCDPYLPLERTEKLTRRCLEVIDRHGFGVSLLTKSDLVLRDLDLLKSINEKSRALVCTTLTTYDEALCGIVEPNVCTTRRRAEMLRKMRAEGIDTGVWLSPILPFINDTEENINGLLDYCFEAGVSVIVCFGMGVTLRDGDRQYFYARLDESFPGIKQRYIGAFGSSYECPSPRADALWELFSRRCRERGVIYKPDEAMAYLTKFEDKLASAQLSLF